MGQSAFDSFELDMARARADEASYDDGYAEYAQQLTERERTKLIVGVGVGNYYNSTILKIIHGDNVKEEIEYYHLDAVDLFSNEDLEILENLKSGLYVYEGTCFNIGYGDDTDFITKGTFRPATAEDLKNAGLLNE